MISLVPYKKELLSHFCYDGVDNEHSGPNIAPIVGYYAQQGKCFIGMIDGRVIGVGGAYPLWDGFGSCYLFLNKEAKKHKIEIFKLIVNTVKELIAEYKIKTMMVECLDDSLEAHRLLKHLGFTKIKIIRMSLYIKEN